MKNKYSVLSIISFSISIICAFFLFVGLFAAKWDYIVTHLFDTLFVLTLGTVTPILGITGIYLLIKAFIRNEFLAPLPLILGGVTVWFLSIFYFSTTFSNVIDLYRIILNI